MSTVRQIEANRRNAKKSTGPTCPEGKAASSMNALKSGIHALTHIIRGEDPDELQALTDEFLRHHRPVGPDQRSLVDTLISAEWTQRRLRRVEAQLWNYQVECLDKNLSHADFIDESIQHNSPLGHAFQDALEAFSRMQRRIECTNRMYLRTLALLQDLQKASAQETPPCEDETEPPPPPAAPDPEAEPPEQIQSLTPQIGFVLSTDSAPPNPPLLSRPDLPPSREHTS
jgi:hypothetical protein